MPTTLTLPSFPGNSFSIMPFSHVPGCSLPLATKTRSPTLTLHFSSFHFVLLLRERIDIHGSIFSKTGHALFHNFSSRRPKLVILYFGLIRKSFGYKSKGSLESVLTNNVILRELSIVYVLLLTKEFSRFL